MEEAAAGAGEDVEKDAKEAPGAGEDVEKDGEEAAAGADEEMEEAASGAGEDVEKDAKEAAAGAAEDVGKDGKEAAAGAGEGMEEKAAAQLTSQEVRDFFAIPLSPLPEPVSAESAREKRLAKVKVLKEKYRRVP